MNSTVLEIVGGVIIVSGVVYYLINKAKKPATTTKSSPVGSVTTINVPAGFVLGAGNVLLQPVTVAVAYADCVSASANLPSGTFLNGLSWNQAEYLRQMSATDFATWCAGLLQVSGAVGGTNSVGWITGLSATGQGFLLTLSTQGISIPATDPRIATK